MRAGARAALGAFGIFVVACIEGEKPTAPSAPQIVVHAVLDMGSRDQLVLVERTRSGIRTSLTNFVGGAEPVLDAEVTITTPNGEVLTAALELQNLDTNELEAVLSDLDMALSEHVPALVSLAKSLGLG